MKSRFNAIYWIAAIVVILLTSVCSYWYHRQIFSGYENRLADIESRLTRTSIDSLTSDDVKIEALRNTIVKTDAELRKDFSTLLNFGLPATIVAILLFVFGIYKFVADEIDKGREKIIAETKSEEARLRDSVRIAFMPMNSTFCQSTLISLGFTNVKPIEIDRITKNDNFDIYFIDNESKVFDTKDDEIKNLLNQIPDKSMIFLLGKNMQGIDIKRFCSASFRSQVYGNLISLARYQKFTQ